MVDTAQAAYRILVHRDQIKEDPELIPFFTDNTSYRWIAPGRHIIAYPICGGTVFNMSTAHPVRPPSLFQTTLSNILLGHPLCRR